MTTNSASLNVGSSAAATLPGVKRDPSKKITGMGIVWAFCRSFLNPFALWTAAKLQASRKAHRHTYDDAQLALYARILPSDFLHFGYFDDVARKPEDMSLSEVPRAQERYAELLLEQVGNRSEPVLDIGCGMGGLSRMLLERGYQPVALTPDRLQVSHVRAKLPSVPVIQTKLERLNAAEYSHRFGTVITSESFQYLKLDQALPILAEVLAPGGRWVLCDFFHIDETQSGTCHQWSVFNRKLKETGWTITHEQDITPNVLPMLRYIHMWATRFGIPAMHFGFLRLRRKQPGLHHLVSGGLEKLEAAANAAISVIDPTEFASKKRYMLLVIQRAEQAAA